MKKVETLKDFMLQLSKKKMIIYLISNKIFLLILLIHTLFGFMVKIDSKRKRSKVTPFRNVCFRYFREQVVFHYSNDYPIIIVFYILLTTDSN